MADRDVLDDALEQFKLSEEAYSANREAALEDIRFARLGEQWPENIAQDRAREGRPMLTINRIPTFGRQVVNDARQNKPTIKVLPSGGGAHRLTAWALQGLIQQIENQSSSKVAYDTGIEFAVYGGFGYWRVDLDYAYDDAFDLDVLVKPVYNPFSIYGDPHPEGMDSRDWNFGFVTDDMPKEQFEKEYPDAEAAGFEGSGTTKQAGWIRDKTVRVAEWWSREQVKRPIVKLSDGSILTAEIYMREKALFDAKGATVTGTREALSHKITHRVITALDVLSEKEWAGCYIPIIPVYGDIVNIEGEVTYKSLFRDAKDPQRMVNFWRTAATELVALAPRVPYIGARGSFTTDAEKWSSANRTSHPHLEYDPVPGQPPPQRQSLDSGVAAGALQEAMNASDDIKSVLGLFDASLGARSNETSGRAIMARQREGDVSTFHFIDNRDRAVEHTGRILVDLIPKVYTSGRMVTILSEDLKERQLVLGAPQPEFDGHIFDLTVGKYSVVAKAGPSYTTKREEAAYQMIEFAKVTGTGQMYADVIAKNLDWPGAEEIEARLKRALPPNILGNGPSQQEQQMQQAIAQLQMELQKAMQELQVLKSDTAVDMAEVQVKHADVQVKNKEAAIKEQEVMLKAKELEIRMMEMAKDAEEIQEQMQSKGLETNVIIEAITALQQSVAAFAQSQGAKRKVGRFQKQADGSWVADVQETPEGGQTLQ